jgi:DNA-binding response OmpR family regulator
MRMNAPGGKLSVLVVDDDPLLLDLLETLLGLADYQVCVARDGREALDAVIATPPDLMVLDINMPVMDGFAVLEELARRDPSESPPILVLTARYAADDVNRALRLGASDYLAKPFSNKTLLMRVHRLLRGRQA